MASPWKGVCDPNTIIIITFSLASQKPCPKSWIWVSAGSELGAVPGKRVEAGGPLRPPLPFVYWIPLAARHRAGFCNLLSTGLNEVFICNSVSSGLGLVPGPGYLFTYFDPRLTYFNDGDCDLCFRTLLCATEHVLRHGQTFTRKPNIYFTQSTFKRNPHPCILTKGRLSRRKGR